MTLAPFDGSAYRRTVLTPLRTGSAAGAEDLFWLGHVPRDLDDSTLIAARLKETKAFLHKERARPRQADVAAAVLREWTRVEGVLTDGSARRSLRLRLGAAEPDPAAAPGGGAPAGASRRSAGGDPAGRRAQQVSAGLAELARLRDEPELAEDLFAFLGLPLTATSSIVAARLTQIGDANRRRRADRERSLTDELLIHARELLVEGDPAVYRGWISGEEPAVGPSTVPAAPPVPEPESRPAVSFQRPPASAPPASTPPATPEPPSAPTTPPVESVSARREADGTVVVTWAWPFGVTEAFVSVGPGSSPSEPGPGGRKVTNVKYELDGGAPLTGIPTASQIRVHTGSRNGQGQLTWNAPDHARDTIAP